jgi:hypothetical protein
MQRAMHGKLEGGSCGVHDKHWREPSTRRAAEAASKIRPADTPNWPKVYARGASRSRPPLLCSSMQASNPMSAS